MIDTRSPLRRIVEVEIPVLLIVLFAIGPYAWMMITSIKPTAEISLWPVRYWPDQPTLQHYRDLLARTTFTGNMRDSFIVALGACVLGLTSVDNKMVMLLDIDRLVASCIEAPEAAAQ